MLRIVPREAARRCRPFTARAWLRLEEIPRLEDALPRSYSPHNLDCQDEVRRIRTLARVTAFFCAEAATVPRSRLPTSAGRPVRALVWAPVVEVVGD